MSGGNFSDRDTPYSKRVVVDVDVNVKASEKPRCEHGNNKGECLLCEKAKGANVIEVRR
jgi:hypothetical protein